MFHHPAMIRNVGSNRQLNPISFCRSDGSELYHIIVTREAALPVKPSSLVSFGSLGLWRPSAQMQNNCLLQDCSDKHK